MTQVTTTTASDTDGQPIRIRDHDQAALCNARYLGGDKRGQLCVNAATSFQPCRCAAHSHGTPPDQLCRVRPALPVAAAAAPQPFNAADFLRARRAVVVDSAGPDKTTIALGEQHGACTSFTDAATQQIFPYVYGIVKGVASSWGPNHPAWDVIYSCLSSSPVTVTAIGSVASTAWPFSAGSSTIVELGALLPFDLGLDESARPVALLEKILAGAYHDADEEWKEPLGRARAAITSIVQQTQGVPSVAQVQPLVTALNADIHARMLATWTADLAADTAASPLHHPRLVALLGFGKCSLASVLRACECLFVPTSADVRMAGCEQISMPADLASVQHLLTLTSLPPVVTKDVFVSLFSLAGSSNLYSSLY